MGAGDARGAAHAVDNAALAEVESLALEIARAAGALAAGALERNLEITYKTEARGRRPPTDPVSETDHAIEQLVRERVGARYPEHAILGEEVDEHPQEDREWVWVIDPVDGTANFINGFPLFAVSIGVLHRGLPVAGAIWCGTTHALHPGVYHARRDGGLRFEGEALDPSRPTEGVRRRLAGAPGGAGAGRREWDNRVTGSAAIEIAFVAAGILTSATFWGLRIWDLAAGVVLAGEAGREAWVREGSRWERFERFAPPGRLPPNVKEQRAPTLRDWRQPMIVGTPEATAILRSTVRGPSRWQRLRRRARRLLRR
ncbi:MAG: inositol monophosphatase [Chloroflexi bacterium]|nr:inositol monophosphatase [Chloroflexota bacterium]